MQEQTLLKIAVITSLIGLFLLFLYTEDLSASNTVDSIENIPAQEDVTITGTVERIHSTNNTQFIEITGQKTITTDVIVFTDEPLFIRAGDIVTISGMVEEYKGSKEIIASKVTLQGRKN